MLFKYSSHHLYFLVCQDQLSIERKNQLFEFIAPEELQRLCIRNGIFLKLSEENVYEQTCLHAMTQEECVNFENHSCEEVCDERKYICPMEENYVENIRLMLQNALECPVKGNSSFFIDILILKYVTKCFVFSLFFFIGCGESKRIYGFNRPFG